MYFKRNGTKFNSRKTEEDGYQFDSQKEAKRYLELKAMMRIGEVKDLELQPLFKAVINGKKVCTYKADFRYKNADGVEIIEDVKSKATRTKSDYRIKKKLMEALHNIEITEYL